MRHLVSTVRVTASGGDTATGVSYVTVYLGEPAGDGPAEVDDFALIGEYHDRYRLTSDGCRITERKLVPVLRPRR